MNKAPSHVDVRAWKTEMLAIAQASPVIKERVPLCVGFVLPDARFAVNFQTGLECEWSAVDCEVSGSDSSFRCLVHGEESLQALALSGEVELQGRAEDLLRLVFVFDECCKALSS